MSVYLEGANWQDRILNHYPPASDGERYYKIIKPDGTVVAEAAKLELLNTVLPGNEGTPVNAGNMNSILAAMGHAKKNYSNTMLAAPYLDTLVGYFTFAGSQIVSAVADITGENTNCTFVAGPHSGQSMGLKGSGATSGVTLSTKACPMGARTIRFRLYMSANTAQTLLDETNLSASNYGTCITVDSSRKVRFRVMQGGTAIVDITTTAAAALNAWTDVCFAWDGTTGTDRVRAYINGSPAGKGKASATPNTGQVPTNNTVLLNQAPLANSGGTAAISELEIWNEARYQDALVLEQKGFSLFDGATVRIYPDFLPAAGTEILLNINEQGNVPVETASLTSGQWNQITYKASSKSFLGTLGALGRLSSDLLDEYFWRATTGQTSKKVETKTATTGKSNIGGSPYNNYYYGCWYASDYDIDGNGYITLVSPKFLYADTSDVSTLRGKYIFTVGGNSPNSGAMPLPSNQSACYYVPTNASITSKQDSGGYHIYYQIDTQTVQAFSGVALGTVKYGNAENTVVPSDLTGTIEGPFKLGSLARITYNEYVGTGANSKTLNIGPTAKLVIFWASSRKDQIVDYNWLPIVLPPFLPITNRTSGMTWRFGPLAGTSSNVYASFSASGTLTLRGSSAFEAFNAADTRYGYVVLG